MVTQRVDKKDEPKMDKKNDEDKKVIDRLNSLARTLGVLKSRVDFLEKERARNDFERGKLKGEIESLKANTCNHQPDKPVQQKISFLQPGQANSVSDIDVSVSQGQNEEIEDLKRLKAMKDQGFRRIDPQTRSVQKPLTPVLH